MLDVSSSHSTPLFLEWTWRATTLLPPSRQCRNFLKRCRLLVRKKTHASVFDLFLCYHLVVVNQRWPHLLTHLDLQMATNIRHFRNWLSRASVKRCMNLHLLPPVPQDILPKPILQAERRERANACNIFIPLLVKTQQVCPTNVRRSSACVRSSSLSSTTFASAALLVQQRFPRTYRNSLIDARSRPKKQLFQFIEPKCTSVVI